MKKLLFLIVLIMTTSLQTLALEDTIVMTNGRLTDISIKDNKIINVYPMITLKNDKNVLIVEPLQLGKTSFCVLRNNKDIVKFDVEVQENKTLVNEVKGFKNFSIDNPPNVFELDTPPKLNKEVI